MPRPLLTPREFARSIAHLTVSARHKAIVQYLSEFEDAGERDEADSFLIAFPFGDDDLAETVIVLIHGIDTAGEWQDRVAAQLSEEHQVHAYPIGYGVVDYIRFWLPFFTRASFVGIVEEKLQAVQTLHPGAKICVVAHSFGTYIVTRLLKERPHLKFDRLLLCGGVVSLKYKWSKVFGQVSAHRIVNEVGTRDVWPVVAGAITFGYGPSGTLGFKYPGVKDRYHDYKHSDYFLDNHVRQYWEPFLLDGRIVPCSHTRERSKTASAARFFAWFPSAIIIWSAVAYGALTLGLHMARYFGFLKFNCPF